MGYSDQSEYPSGRFHTVSLTNVAQDVGVAGEDVKVSHWLARGGATGDDTIIFRNSAGATEYFRVTLAADERIVVPAGFEANLGGLEVLTAAAATDVELTIFFWQQ